MAKKYRKNSPDSYGIETYTVYRRQGGVPGKRVVVQANIWHEAIAKKLCKVSKRYFYEKVMQTV